MKVAAVDIDHLASGGEPVPDEMFHHPWVEWGRDLHPRTISAQRKNDLWVVQKMGVYFDTDILVSKIAHVIDYHGDEVASIRVDLGLI